MAATRTDEVFVPPTKEFKVLKRNFSKLLRAITVPSLLPVDLFSADLITFPILQKATAAVTASDTLITELITNLLQAVIVDFNNFQKLLQVLEKHPPLLTAVAKEMKEEYESCDDVQLLPPADRDLKSNEEQKTINVSQHMQGDYENLRGKLGELVYDFKKKVEEANIDINDLKDFISLYDPDEKCSSELQEARDISQVFFIVRTKFCSLFNYSILQKIAEKFNLKGGYKVIQSYEAAKENYRRLLTSSALAEELHKESKFPPNIKGTIILRLKWSSVKQLTVSEFENIIKEVFSELTCYIHLLKVEPGSIIVTMCAPERVVGALIALAKRRIAYLTDVGVTWLTIGDVIIINGIEDTAESSHHIVEQNTEVCFTSSDKLMKNTNKNQISSSAPVGVITATVSQLSKPLVLDDTGDDTDLKTGSDSATPLFVQTWRHHPHVSAPREILIIGSFGDCVNLEQQQHTASQKILPINLSDEWRRDEIEKVADFYKRNHEGYHIQSVCYDLPGEEYSKKYYMETIKTLFINCQQLGGAVIYYTGHGEKDTGNWCFKDGVITVNDIFDLYVTHFKGKPLFIISDCSYSGNWINDCAKRLDEMNVPSCGHHTREQGLLFQIFTSCQPNEEATALCYINEAVEYSEADKAVLFYTKMLTSGQKTMWTDFKYIRCGKSANESCEADSDCTWNDCLNIKYHLVYLVRGKDRGCPAWYYVVVDEEKLDDFKAKVATGTMDVTVYGRILKSGWGEDPPKDIVRKINLRYGNFIDPV